MGQQHMDGKEKLRLFRRFFCGRPDVYAQRLQEGDFIPYGLQVGAYVPRREPKYQLTDSMLIKHMRGDVMLGSYPLLKNGDTNWIAADFDAHNGCALEDALSLSTKLREYGIEPLCNTSKSGVGIHVRIIFAEPIEAWIMRRFMNLFLFDECNLDRLNNGGAYDRCFPAQDALRKDDKKAIGNQIVMPLNQRAAERKGCILLDQRFNPIPLGPATWDFMATHEAEHLFNRKKMMRTLLAFERCNILAGDPKDENVLGAQVENFVPANPEKQYTATSGNKMTRGDLANMVASCKFFHYSVCAPLGYYEWLALASNLAPFAHCGGRETFHDISATDTGVDRHGNDRYNWRITETKFDDVVHEMRPITCASIAREGWQCTHLGSDGQCDKFRSGNGRGPKAPAAVPRFL
jgi:hypothetical protein